ncbi:hypothetical protein HanIR_Chr14g0708011 [Helianthus annuus]|nr:hypothetical protein HanIR_Chr14g0708011 [Helianthus annuus]
MVKIHAQLHKHEVWANQHEKRSEFTCKQIVSHVAADPQLPSFPFLTSLGRRSLKYKSHILLLILIESALGCNTYIAYTFRSISKVPFFVIYNTTNGVLKISQPVGTLKGAT